MKHVLLGLIIFCATSHLNAQSKGTTGSVQWSLDNSVLSITGSGAMGDYNLTTNKAPWHNQKDQILSVEIEEGVTNIGAYALAKTAVAAISLPGSVTQLGEGAFSDCSNLVSIDLPNSVTGAIETNTFHRCINLQSVSLSKNITKIGHYAFAYTQIESLIIPDEVTTIESFVFFECKNLKNVTLPKKLKELGETTFQGCDQLTAIVIPEGVSRIEGRTFKQCTRLQTAKIPLSVTYIGEEAFSQCSNLTNTVLPDNLLKIGEWAFFKCRKLSTVKIPASIKKIEDHTFHGCVTLDSVEMSNGVTHIGYASFADCSSLNSVTIPESVIYIDKGAFSGETKLKVLTVQWKIPISLEDGSFLNQEGCKLLVPKESSDAYKNAAVWKNFVIEGYNYIPTSNESIMNESIAIFPNPAINYIQIKGGNLDALAIFDCNGRKVWEQFHVAENIPMDISALAKGVYFVRTAQKGNIQTTKIIKR